MWRHIIETYFPDIFFWYLSMFYLDNPALAIYVKSKENYKHAKKWASISSRRKTLLYLYEQNINI